MGCRAQGVVVGVRGKGCEEVGQEGEGSRSCKAALGDLRKESGFY